LTLFFAPTCKVHIHDPVTSSRFTVDNVPAGLGMVAGIISQIGDVATKEIEKTFSIPDDLKYHKTGSVLASNLISDARTFHITNTELSDTMRSFMNQCVVYDALLGKKYTWDTLKNSPDIWRLVTENPSPARSFLFKAPGKGASAQILTCQKGAALLDDLLKTENTNAFQLFERKIFGNASQTPTLNGQLLKQYLPVSFNYMTKMAKSAEELMMQQMMIYSLVDATEQKSTSLGNAPNFAVRRAYLQQRETQETLGQIAAQKLIAMKNVMEALIYAAFIFMLPMALLPIGWKFISRWVGLVMWIQLWPPLYAVLNFIMNISVRSKGIGILGDAGGITLANSVGFMNLHADMAAQAGFMSVAVGSLAYALVRGGAASFVHLASHLASPAVSAAGRAAEDLMSGNYSFGNVSQGTVQANNSTFGQQNLSPSHASGSFTQNDGMKSRTTTAEGSHLINVSSSNLRTGINLSESLSNSYTEQSSEARQAAENSLVAATHAKADHNRQLLDLSTHQAHQSSESESYYTGETASQNQAFTTLDGLVDRFAKDHSVSKEQAQQLLGRVSASVSAGVGFEVFGTGASATTSSELTGQVWGSKIDREMFSAAQDYSKQQNFQEALNQGQQAAHDMRYSELSDKGQKYVSSLNASYDKSEQYREEASASFQKSEAFSKMAAFTKQNAGSINANLSQEYVNWLQEQPLPNSEGHMGIHEAETILSSRPNLDHQYQQRFLESKMQSYFDSQGLLTTNSDIEATYSQSKEGISHKEDFLHDVAAKASEQGFGDTFKLNSKPRSDVKEQLSFMEDQLIEQKEILEKQSGIRKDEKP
ncbi:MAG: hypothetical protein HOI80_04890, partial [Alphaproteobacteria bacterium]|nr:hypothetical protein [Alphaproteobacteria bacterium]